MTISAIAPIGSGVSYVYAPLAAEVAAVAAPQVLAEQSAVTAAAAALDRTTTTAADPEAPAAAPFANPAIDEIATEASTAAALGGDSGLLVQSYGAVALVTATIALSQVFPDAHGPAVTPPLPVERIAGPAPVA